MMVNGNLVGKEARRKLVRKGSKETRAGASHNATLVMRCSTILLEGRSIATREFLLAKTIACRVSCFSKCNVEG
jgi:hypothetical protein